MSAIVVCHKAWNLNQVCGHFRMFYVSFNKESLVILAVNTDMPLNTMNVHSFVPKYQEASKVNIFKYI